MKSLKRADPHPTCWTTGLEGPMFTHDSYKDVLGDYSRRHHLIGSAWIVAIALGVLIVMFA